MEKGKCIKAIWNADSADPFRETQIYTDFFKVFYYTELHREKILQPLGYDFPEGVFVFFKQLKIKQKFMYLHHC